MQCLFIQNKYLIVSVSKNYQDTFIKVYTGVLIFFEDFYDYKYKNINRI